jgi:hypothetical protein
MHKGLLLSFVGFFCCTAGAAQELSIVGTWEGRHAHPSIGGELVDEMKMTLAGDGKYTMAVKSFLNGKPLGNPGTHAGTYTYQAQPGKKGQLEVVVKDAGRRPTGRTGTVEWVNKDEFVYVWGKTRIQYKRVP